jgi:5-(carboxyamino)imidazole ribonucleotide mutase
VSTGAAPGGARSAPIGSGRTLDGMAAQVSIIMGSDSDWRVMEAAKAVLDELGVAAEVDVVSAHRTPQKMVDFARGAADRGVRVIIAGAGGAAHLPGMVASMTRLPVVGVPVPLEQLDGLDSLLSIVQMPAGIPVATVSIGGARNAGILAARMLGAFDAELGARLDAFAADLERQVDGKAHALRERVATGERADSDA